MKKALIHQMSIWLRHLENHTRQVKDPLIIETTKTFSLPCVYVMFFVHLQFAWIHTQLVVEPFLSPAEDSYVPLSSPVEWPW